MDAAKVAHDAESTRAISRRQMLTEMRERGMLDETLLELDRLARHPDLYETPKSHARRLEELGFPHERLMFSTGWAEEVGTHEEVLQVLQVDPDHEPLAIVPKFGRAPTIAERVAAYVRVISRSFDEGEETWYFKGAAELARKRLFELLMRYPALMNPCVHFRVQEEDHDNSRMVDVDYSVAQWIAKGLGSRFPSTRDGYTHEQLYAFMCNVAVLTGLSGFAVGRQIELRSNPVSVALASEAARPDLIVSAWELGHAMRMPVDRDVAFPKNVWPLQYAFFDAKSTFTENDRHLSDLGKLYLAESFIAACGTVRSNIKFGDLTVTHNPPCPRFFELVKQEKLASVVGFVNRVVERLVKAVFRAGRETPGPDGVTDMVDSLVDGLVASGLAGDARGGAEMIREQMCNGGPLLVSTPEALAFMKALTNNGVVVRGTDIVPSGSMTEMHSRWPTWALAFEVFERKQAMRRVMDAALGRNGATTSTPAPAAGDQVTAALTELAEAPAQRRRRAAL